MSTLGERIRTLRKQQKMTLEALAGNQLTKGMLSLIENNKANPSMDSLTYIAERLGVEVAELMEEVSLKELREVLKAAEKLFSVEFDELTDKNEQIIHLISPYEEKLTQGYEAARLLEIYSQTLHAEKKEGWQKCSDKAAQIYDQLNIIPRLAAIGVFRSLVKFTEHDYESALAILLKERKAIEARNVFIDPLTRLDFDYLIAVLYFAVGKPDEAIRVMENGIDYSRQERVFYRIDHLYRMASFNAMMRGDEESRIYYNRKLELYADLSDDDEPRFFNAFSQVHYLTTYKKSYQEALDCIHDFFKEHQLSSYFSPYAFLERGKVQYGLGKFEDALSYLEKVEIPIFLHHPFDLSLFYAKDAYAGLCHLSLGQEKKALTSIKEAVKNISPMPESPYKEFILDTYTFIKEHTN